MTTEGSVYTGCGLFDVDEESIILATNINTSNVMRLLAYMLKKYALHLVARVKAQLQDGAE